jgi:hypothetical protein
MQIFLVILITVLSRYLEKQKPSVASRDFNDVTLGSSAVFEIRSLNEAQEKRRKRNHPDIVRSVAFRPHLSMGLALPDVVSASLRQKPQGGKGAAS